MPTRVYVGNLPGDVRESELEDLFAKHRPDCIDLPHKAKGFAFLIFDDRRDAEDCIRDMDCSEFAGRRLRVNISIKAGGGGGGFGGGGGGGFERIQDRLLLRLLSRTLA